MAIKLAIEYAKLCIGMRLGNARSSAIADGSAVAEYRPTGAASGRGIVDPARCLVTVYRWVWVSGRAASSARSAGRATCGRTGMARSGPAPGVTSSCRAAKAASSPRGARPTWDGERRRRTLGGRAQGRPGPQAAQGVPPWVADSYELDCPGAAAKLRCHSATGSRLGVPGWTFAGLRGAKWGANGDRH